MLHEVIKFRNLADSITETEFNLFLTKLYNKFNKRQLVLSSLFHLFNAQKNGDQDNASKSNCNVSKTMDILSSIIQSRDINHKEVTVKMTKNKPIISLSNLSSDIIGFCASYLPFNDYHSFEKCSRHIYVSCNNPNTLQYIKDRTFSDNGQNIYHLSKPQYLQLLKYKNVTNLEMNMQSYENMNYLYGMPLPSNITALGLNYVNQNSLQAFLSLDQCNFDKITNLSLIHYDLVWADDTDLPSEAQKSVAAFCDILMKVRNVKYLRLSTPSFVTIPEVYEKLVSKLEDAEFRSKILNKLEAFAFFSGGGQITSETNFCNKLLHYFSNQLIALYFHATITPPINGFTKLRELMIQKANYSRINNVIQTAKSLERIFLVFQADDINNLDQQRQERLKRTLVELFNQITLRCIIIIIDRDIDIILNALREINWENRKEMRFCFVNNDRSDKILEYLNILEGKLRMSSSDYVLRMKFVLTEDMVDVAKKVDIGDKVSETPTEDGEFIDVVWTNDGCKLDGYLERWIHLKFWGCH